MTKEEAYELLNDGTKQDEAIKIALDALKKQIPTLPVQPKECVRYGHGYDITARLVEAFSLLNRKATGYLASQDVHVVAR